MLVDSKKGEGRKKDFFPKPKIKIGKKKILCEMDLVTAQQVLQGVFIYQNILCCVTLPLVHHIWWYMPASGNI